MARLMFLLVLIALPAVIMCVEGDLTNEDVDAAAAAYKELIASHGNCPDGEVNVPGEGGTVQCGIIPKIPNAVCLGVKALCKAVSIFGC